MLVNSNWQAFLFVFLVVFLYSKWNFHFTFFSGLLMVMSFKRLAMIDSSKLLPSLYVSTKNCWAFLTCSSFYHGFYALLWSSFLVASILSSSLRFFILFFLFLSVFIAFRGGALLNNLLIYFLCCICSIYVAMDFLLLYALRGCNVCLWIHTLISHFNRPNS